MPTTYWLPTIPYSLIDAINRMAAATGSVSYAQKATYADYNGHSVTIAFNTYRKYWTCEYYWGERVVLQRGSFEDCVRAGVEEYKRGAKGAQVLVTIADDSQAEQLTALGFVPWSKDIADAHYASFADKRFALVNEALRTRTDGILANVATAKDYWVARDTADFGPVEKVCHLKKGNEVMDIYVRARRIKFYIGSKNCASAQLEPARKLYRDYVAAGWVAF